MSERESESLRLTPAEVEELCERSKDDRAIIVGGEVRQLCGLAKAYLRDNPADDDEPITEEWLRSAGFTTAANDHWLWIGGDLRIASRCDDSRWQLSRDDEDSDSFDIPVPKTRRDVRLLCRALSIELKTPT